MKTLSHDSLWKIMGIIVILLLVVTVAVYQQKYNKLRHNVNVFSNNIQLVNNETAAAKEIGRFLMATSNSSLQPQTSQAGFFGWLWGKITGLGQGNLPNTELPGVGNYGALHSAGIIQDYQNEQ